jgi:hypothetical protein
VAWARWSGCPTPACSTAARCAATASWRTRDGEILLRSSQHEASFTANLGPGPSLEGGVQYRDGLLEGTASEVTSLIGTQARRRQFRGPTSTTSVAGSRLPSRGE